MTFALLALLAVALALGLHVSLVEPRRLVVRRIAFDLPGLAAPVRVVAVADLQPWRVHWSGRRLKRLFAGLRERERPDLVLWLGDYYNQPTKGSARLLARWPLAERAYHALQTPFSEICDAMAELRAPMGAFAVIGNHDWGWSGEATADGLRRAGIAPLIGEAATAEHPRTGARITLVGLDDASAGRPHGAERLLPVAEPAILLTHAPDVWDEVAAPALTLAGHTHGGQVVFPLIGAAKLPELGRRHVRGWFRRPGAALFVSVGMGCSGLPVRLGCVPEVVVIELRPAPLRQVDRIGQETVDAGRRTGAAQ